MTIIVKPPQYDYRGLSISRYTVISIYCPSLHTSGAAVEQTLSQIPYKNWKGLGTRLALELVDDNLCPHTLRIWEHTVSYNSNDIWTCLYSMPTGKEDEKDLKVQWQSREQETRPGRKGWERILTWLRELS